MRSSSDDFEVKLPTYRSSWFSAGEIGVGTPNNDATKRTTQQASLLDKAMFVTEEDTTNNNETSSKPVASSTTRSKSLIDHMVPKRGS